MKRCHKNGTVETSNSKEDVMFCEFVNMVHFRMKVKIKSTSDSYENICMATISYVQCTRLVYIILLIVVRKPFTRASH